MEKKDKEKKVDPHALSKNGMVAGGVLSGLSTTGLVGIKAIEKGYKIPSGKSATEALEALKKKGINVKETKKLGKLGLGAGLALTSISAAKYAHDKKKEKKYSEINENGEVRLFSASPKKFRR